MSRSYNALAGHSTERLAALSDGIFGVGMTLLVLDLRTPAETLIHGEGDLRHALAGLLPQLVMYLMSFITLGIFWVGQQTQLNQIERTDRHLTWLHLAFLFAVTLMPFSTRLLAEFHTYRAALLAYWGNIALLGVTIYSAWGYATRRQLLKAEAGYEVAAAVCRRIRIAQGLYAFGALLCVFGTAWSIAFIVLVQLNYAIAPAYWKRL